jgi:hypothetical protein
MWGWVCVGLPVAALLGWIALRIRKYRRLSADEHYFEMAREVARLKTAALDKVIALGADEAPSPSDPRASVTGAGLALFYTVRRSDDRFIHHYSVGVAGGYTSRLVGEMFTLFVARLLGVPFEALTLEVGRSTVHHAEFNLSAAEQSKFAERAVPAPSPAEVTSFRKEYLGARERLRWKRL